MQLPFTAFTYAYVFILLDAFEYGHLNFTYLKQELISRGMHDRFIFRSSFPGMRLTWECHDQSQETNRPFPKSPQVSPSKRVQVPNLCYGNQFHFQYDWKLTFITKTWHSASPRNGGWGELRNDLLPSLCHWSVTAFLSQKQKYA